MSNVRPWSILLQKSAVTGRGGWREFASLWRFCAIAAGEQLSCIDRCRHISDARTIC
jgi:hypothetical protein